MKQLTHITPKQQDILRQLYTYRFLDRAQIQTALGHKDKSKIQIWLNDLRAKGYVVRIYDSSSLVAKTKLAVYYLGIEGIRFLRAERTEDGKELYPLQEIRKRYKDSSRSEAFIERSLLVASCALALRALSTGTQPVGLVQQQPEPVKATEPVGRAPDAPRPTTFIYSWYPEAHYIDPEHRYHFLAEHETLRPNLCVVKRGKSGRVVANYLLEIFDANLPRYRMRYRLKQYVAYLDDESWEGDEVQPTVLLVCGSLSDLIYAKRATKKLIDDTYADAGTLRVRFATIHALRAQGIAAPIWEEGRRVWGV